MNNLQNNPSNAADEGDGGESRWPDWNSKHGTGTEPASDDSVDFAENFEMQREGAKERLEESEDSEDANSSS